MKNSAGGRNIEQVVFRTEPECNYDVSAPPVRPGRTKKLSRCLMTAHPSRLFIGSITKPPGCANHPAE